ncbi:MAG TPA: efflux RND transporter permease subunit, partial [Thermoanaerobaculia bacterium]|nr:efflux RND transporter permease subunit [Thermoanaerobaculia bacterium]
MLSAIVRFSLRFRGVVIALASLAIGYGIYVTANAKYDVFPEFATPQISIQTEAPGLSADQVEVLVTQRIENSINGSPGVETIRSESVQGLSLIVVNFNGGSDIYRARQDVGERLTELTGVLPAGVQAPVMTPLTSSSGDLLTIGLVSDKQTPMQLRTIADCSLLPRMLAVPGIAKATVYGGDVRQVQIQVDPARLIAHELSLEDVRAAAAKATGVRGAGFIDTKNQRIVLRTAGESLTAAEIGAIVVAHQPQGNVTLADVASVIDAARPGISEASVMGRRAVVMNLWAQYGANTLDTTHDVERALEQLGPALKAQGVTVYPEIFRSASYIALATHNINNALLLGAVLVVVVLFLFLASFRAAAISCTAIPLSLLIAIVVMQRLGLTLNTLTLGGLAIAIGEVVDDAVIDVENIQRRLREWSSSVIPSAAEREESGAAYEARDSSPSSRLGMTGKSSLFDVVFDASLEVRSAVVYATFAVALVFLPILTMSGLAGRLFAPMGLAYIFSILASLLVALTLTPALATLLLRGRALDREERSWLQHLKTRYRAILVRVEAYPT